MNMTPRMLEDTLRCVNDFDGLTVGDLRRLLAGLPDQDIALSPSLLWTITSPVKEA